VQPEDFGLRRYAMDDLLVESPDESADVIRGILAGEGQDAGDDRPAAARSIVLLNAGAALTVADKAKDIKAGLAMAADAIATGAAAAALEKLVTISNAGA